MKKHQNANKKYLVKLILLFESYEARLFVLYDFPVSNVFHLQLNTYQTLQFLTEQILSQAAN